MFCTILCQTVKEQIQRGDFVQPDDMLAGPWTEKELKPADVWAKTEIIQFLFYKNALLQHAAWHRKHNRTHVHTAHSRTY